MVPWATVPEIEIDLDLPVEQRYDHVPADVFAKGRRLLQAIMGEIPAGVKYVADAVRLRTAGRFHAEARTLARRVDANWREVILANVSYDLALASMGCSTVALPTPAGPVLGRNLDWWPEEILAQTSCVIRSFRDGQLAFVNAGWPGAIGASSGLSGRGFGVVVNAVLCAEGSSKTGYPVLLHIRRVLEDAQDFDTAVNMLSEEKLATSCLLTVVGIKNEERVVIERTPKQSAQRWGQCNKALVTTNDYRKMFKPQATAAGEIYESTCMRYDALNRFFAEHPDDEKVSDSALLYILSDPSVIQTITAQHIIMRPRQCEISLQVPRRLLGSQAAD